MNSQWDESTHLCPAALSWDLDRLQAEQVWMYLGSLDVWIGLCLQLGGRVSNSWWCVKREMALSTPLCTAGFWKRVKMRLWTCAKSCMTECSPTQQCTLVWCSGRGGMRMWLCASACLSLFHLPDSLCGLCLELSELPCWFHVVFQNHYQWPLRTGSHGTFCALPEMHESLCPHPPSLCSAA